MKLSNGVFWFWSFVLASADRLYYDVGRLIAVSLVHGGPAPKFFSKVLFHAIAKDTGSKISASINDIADGDMKSEIQQVCS